MSILMYDTVSGTFQGGVPDNAEAILFYVDGLYANGNAARARFPHLFEQKRAMGFTVRGRVAADGDDFETGNWEGNIGTWVKDDLAAGAYRPICYEDRTDERNTVIPELEAQFGSPLPPPGPNRPFRLLVALPDGDPTIPPEADAKQYWWGSIQGNGSVDMDITSCRDDFFQPLAPVDPHHYLWFCEGPFDYHGKSLNEREIVKQYDLLRAEQTWHSHPHRPELAVLRDELLFLAKRVAYEAHIANPGVSVAHALATDPVAHRGWRFQQLVKRAQGQEVKP